MNVRNKPVEKILAAIETLDLDPIKFKLMDPEEGQGWTREQVDRLEIDYKRFLALLVKYPDTAIAPSKEVDSFWHGHILDTIKYAEDCEQVFGYFLHHFPYFGMRGADDAAALAAAGKATAELYEKEFGQSPSASAAYCSAATKQAAYCSAATKQPAYCSVAKPAYCSVAITQAAYCSAATKQPAYCSAAKPAYCSVAITQAAYCSAATKQQAAYCSAAAKQTAYCSATAKPAAYCSASVSANFDATTRPALAA